MTEPARTRRVAVREWTCPNHPDGPPTLPADGAEREEMTFEEAYGKEDTRELRAILMHATSDPKFAEAAPKWIAELGLCCVGCQWKTVGYEDTPVSPFEGMLLEMQTAIVPVWRDHSVLLSEIARGSGSGDVRIPLVFDSDPGDEQS